MSDSQSDSQADDQRQVGAAAVSLIAGASAAMGPGGASPSLSEDGVTTVLAGGGAESPSSGPLSSGALPSAKEITDAVSSVVAESEVLAATSRIMTPYGWFVGYRERVRNGEELSGDDRADLFDRLDEVLQPGSTLKHGLYMLYPNRSIMRGIGYRGLPMIMLGAGLLITLTLLDLARQAEQGGTIEPDQWQAVVDVAGKWAGAVDETDVLIRENLLPRLIDEARASGEVDGAPEAVRALWTSLSAQWRGTDETVVWSGPSAVIGQLHRFAGRAREAAALTEAAGA